jgi:hypothetical protein
MKKRYLAYAIIPTLAFVAAVGATTASAHGWGMMSNATPDEIAQRQTEMFQEKADLLGIGVDELKNYWAQGKDVREIAEEKGISEETIQSKMQEQRKAQMTEHLKTLVDKGVITQQQADQRLQFMEQNQDKFGRMGRGGRHGMGGGMMGGFGF